MKVYKPYTNKQYADLAVYCNQNGLIIEDKGDYLESVNPPAPTKEDLQAAVREVRNSYLVEYVDPYQLVIRWGTFTEAEQNDLINYRQYLLDYTDGQGWWEENPLTFEEWKQGQAVLMAEE